MDIHTAITITNSNKVQGRRNEKRARGADFVEGHRQNFNYSACRRRGGVLKCPRLCFFSFFFFSVSKEGAALMGDTAVQNIYCYLSPCQHEF